MEGIEFYSFRIRTTALHLMMRISCNGSRRKRIIPERNCISEIRISEVVDGPKSSVVSVKFIDQILPIFCAFTNKSQTSLEKIWRAEPSHNHCVTDRAEKGYGGFCGEPSSS